MIFSMSDLSQVTSPPFRSFRIMESPSTRWPLTEIVRPDERYTISAFADAASTSEPTITVKVIEQNLSFMRDGYPTTRLEDLSRNSTVELQERPFVAPFSVSAEDGCYFGSTKV